MNRVKRTGQNENSALAGQCTNKSGAMNKQHGWFSFQCGVSVCM